MFPCGLTNSPTSCPWEGSAVGLEPTAHGKGGKGLSAPLAVGVEPTVSSSNAGAISGSRCQWSGKFSALDTCECLAKSSRPLARSGCALLPSPCDYIIAYLCWNVNTFLKKNKKTF